MSEHKSEPTAVSLRWHRIYRVVAARHPPINVFEDIVGARQLDTAWHIESLTNDRLRDESGEAPLVADEDRLRGPGASIVMAPFTHLGRPSRFSDGSYGVYYAARSLETAVRETAFHRGRFLAATSEPPCEVDMRAYVGPAGQAVPRYPRRALRGSARSGRLRHAAEIRAAAARQRAWGLVYRSVRHAGGECIAAFRPQAVSIPMAGAALAYVWDGERVNKVYEKSEVLFEL